MDGFAPFDYGQGLVPEDPFALDGYSIFDVLSSVQLPDSILHDSNVTSTNDAANELVGLVHTEIPESSSVIVPKPMPGILLPERMLRALSILKEASTGGGILAQVWMPIRQGNSCVLSTCDQPFLLDKMLAGYREVSRQFTFSAVDEQDMFPGLPGRVFISGMPEWTSNVLYYHRFEYLRVDYAMTHEVRGSLAMPVYDPNSGSCCAVLEVVMTREKDNFDVEMDSVSNALQSVNLRTVKSRPRPQSITKNQKSALTEILDVLRAVCHAHILPLALTWVHAFSSNINDDDFQEVKSGSRSKYSLCIQESACYVNDVRMNDFLHACVEHPLEKGQGIAGKALLSNHPFFSSDVREYDIQDYPLAHHARRSSLCAAVAIRLRSTYTGHDDYILEFFLPVNCRGSEEQQLLLNNLSKTMQRICKTLRTVSDAELTETNIMKACNQSRTETTDSASDLSVTSSQQIGIVSDSTTNIPFGSPKKEPDEHFGDLNPEKLTYSSITRPEKKRSMTEKHISLSVLRQYFSGSLKDAARNIGVCPTTLKRICRQHGIQRWPSRKIKKVNRSLNKIQNVINSVHGVEGALKYDPASGSIVSSVYSPETPTLMTVKSGGCDAGPIETESSVLKFEPDCDQYKGEQPGQLLIPDICKSGANETVVHQSDGRLFQQLNTEATPIWPRCGANSNSSFLIRETACEVSVLPLYSTNAHTDTDDGVVEYSVPSSSSMTDSSSGSASSQPTFKKGPKCVSASERSPAITVKATYRDDTVRFKLLPSMGYQHLLEEIATRLKLLMGMFQLKYMDDEEEWVILASDSDLQECLEILETNQSHSVKIQAKDVPCLVGSSASSSDSLLVKS